MTAAGSTGQPRRPVLARPNQDTAELWRFGVDCVEFSWR